MTFEIIVTKGFFRTSNFSFTTILSTLFRNYKFVFGEFPYMYIDAFKDVCCKSVVSVKGFFLYMANIK